MTLLNAVLAPTHHGLYGETNPICMSCGRDWRWHETGSAVMATTLTDEPGDGLHINAGCPRIVTAYLCGPCIERRGNNGFSEFVPVCEGQPIVSLTSKDGNTFPSHVCDAPQPVTPPTWFEGRSASLAKHCKDVPKFKAYCESMERRGLRVVGGYSSEADRRAVYHFGLMFGKEAATGPPNVFVHPRLVGVSTIAYLVKNQEGTEYVGAMSFERNRFITLVWAWLRPDFRRRGILSHYWPIFESAHAKFRVLSPLSESMKSFLSRHEGHEVTETT